MTVIACFANLYYYGNLLSLLPGSGNLRFWGYILFSPKLENIWLPKLCFSKKTHILYILTRADQLIVMKWTFVHLYIYQMDLNYVVLQLSQFITCKTCVKTSSGWFRKIPTLTQKVFEFCIEKWQLNVFNKNLIQKKKFVSKFLHCFNVASLWH